MTYCADCMGVCRDGQQTGPPAGLGGGEPRRSQLRYPLDTLESTLPRAARYVAPHGQSEYGYCRGLYRVGSHAAHVGVMMP
jgi:hypothetical protein